MNTDPMLGTETPVSGKSRRCRNQIGKSPGRVAAGKRLHALGFAGMGGRKPTHGFRMLAELAKV
jgi:hypothetical protein